MKLLSSVCNSRPLKILLTICILIPMAMSCRTTDSVEFKEAGEEEEQSPAAVTEKKLGQTTAQNLYLELLKAELNAGVKVSESSLRTSRGQLQCYRNGVLETCKLRTLLMGTELSEPVSTDKELSALAWQHVKALRSDLLSDRIFIVDIICDSVGAESPPYNADQLTCKFHYPRSTNELVLLNLQGERMADALRSGRTFVANKITLHGAISCTALGEGDSDQRHTCVVRPVVDKRLSQDVVELDATLSAQVARKMAAVSISHQILHATGPNKVFKAPSNLVGSVICHVDLQKEDSDRDYICLVRQ